MPKLAHKTKGIIIGFFIFEFFVIAFLANILMAQAKSHSEYRGKRGSWKNYSQQISVPTVSPQEPTNTTASSTNSQITSSTGAIIIATSTIPSGANQQPATTTRKLLWGAFAGNDTGDLERFEGLVGKEVDLQGYFVGWNDDFPDSIAANLKLSGKTLVIYWEQYGVSLDDIIAGKSDSYISKFAADAKDSGVSIILAPFHEMNGNWDPWDGSVGSNSPAKIISAWRRIHDAFIGVSNVKFGWAVNNVSVPNTTNNSIAVYYPGDNYVDYVGVDGFNFDNPWQSFSDVFDSAIKQLAGYQKPIFIFSMSSAPGTEKAAWIRDGLGTKIYEYPNLIGWVWFNHQAEANWLINSDSASLEAFKDILP